MSEKLTTKQEVSISARFTQKVIAEFGAGAGEAALTDSQKRLAQNYFIAIDEALQATENRRQAKRSNKDPVPVTWNNVDLNSVAQGVVSSARIGWDPLQSNHVFVIPFKDNSTNKYTINFMPGYRGLELKATKYGLDVPDEVVVELVYSTDNFKPVKRDRQNKVESYEFEITNAFNRGEIIGGFYYHSYKDNPEKNKLVMMSIQDIKKRKPEYASVEFWGGEKDEWVNGEKTGRKTKIEGWYEEMCWKTVFRAAYNDITIDSQKIDDDYQRIKKSELDFHKAEVDAEISEKANAIYIDAEFEDYDKDTGELLEEVEEPATENATTRFAIEEPTF